MNYAIMVLVAKALDIELKIEKLTELYNTSTNEFMSTLLDNETRKLESIKEAIDELKGINKNYID